MSASPPPHAGGEARKRKRARGDDEDGDDDQQQEYGRDQGGSHQAREQATLTTSGGSTADTNGQPGYTSRYGPPAAVAAKSSSSEPTPSNVATSERSQHAQDTAQSASTSQSSNHTSNGTSSTHPSTSSTAASSTGQHSQAAAASRPAKFDRKDRILTRDTLEPSYFVVEPNDEFTREVGDWLWGWICNRANVEIEGKIGLLVDARPNLPPKTRVSFPLATETILTDTSFARFQSNMSLRQHHHFNQILNMRATEAAQPSYQGAPIRYLHTKETDSFYHSTRAIPGGSAGKTKVRVTRDQATGQIKANDPSASVMKSRIADMNVYSPKRGFDFRISVSVEEPVPIPTSKPTHERWKDRVSYRHQAFQIDLTQVRSSENKEVLHELEIEFSDMPLLMQEGYKAARGEESLYYDLVQVFLNNIRMLIRNACPP
ncbi:mRNA triphosphatase CET1 [Cystobasidium minutum MCA 4210]|uniref:mRNA triphosphatase CET1 n=1 Tax=Cystobasidium minutum MCA 4210 TaxID=1397322 RepID=UPI0034CFB309|eukprot:jgi/Rhomi1/62483/CE62482_901